jgi:hypothetical protein
MNPGNRKQISSNAFLFNIPTRYKKRQFHTCNEIEKGLSQGKAF